MIESQNIKNANDILIPTVADIMTNIKKYETMMSGHYAKQKEMEDSYYNNTSYCINKKAEEQGKDQFQPVLYKKKIEIGTESWMNMYVSKIISEYSQEEYEVDVTSKTNSAQPTQQEMMQLKEMVSEYALKDSYREVIEDVFRQMIFGQSYCYVHRNDKGEVEIERIDIGDGYFDHLAKKPSKEDAEWCAVRVHKRKKSKGKVLEYITEPFIHFYWRSEEKGILHLIINEKKKQFVPFPDGRKYTEYLGKMMPLVFFGFIASRRSSIGMNDVAVTHDRYEGIMSPLRSLYEQTILLNTYNEAILMQAKHLTNSINILTNVAEEDGKCIQNITKTGGIAFIAPKTNIAATTEPSSSYSNVQQNNANTDIKMFSINGGQVSESLLALAAECKKSIFQMIGFTGASVNGNAPNQSGSAIEQQSYQANAGLKQVSIVMRRGLDTLTSAIIDVTVGVISQEYAVDTENIDPAAADVEKVENIDPRHRMKELLDKCNIKILSTPATDLDMRKDRAQLSELAQMLATLPPEMRMLVPKLSTPRFRDDIEKVAAVMTDQGMIDVLNNTKDPAEYREELAKNQKPSPDDVNAEATKQMVAIQTYAEKRSIYNEEKAMEQQKIKDERDYQIELRKLDIAQAKIDADVQKKA